MCAGRDEMMREGGGTCYTVSSDMLLTSAASRCECLPCACSRVLFCNAIGGGPRASPRRCFVHQPASPAKAALALHEQASETKQLRTQWRRRPPGGYVHRFGIRGLDATKIIIGQVFCKGSCMALTRKTKNRENKGQNNRQLSSRVLLPFCLTTAFTNQH